MARAKIREVSAPSAIQGVARPVNTYVRPADPAPSPLHELAEGLAKFDAGLGAFLDKRKADQEEADKQRAIHDAYLDNAPGYDEGVKRGLIPAQESKVYMDTLKKTKAEIRGRQLLDEWTVTYQQWGDRAKADPEAFKTFLGGFLRERIADINDPATLSGLNPYVERLYTIAYDDFTRDRSNAIKADYLATVGSGIMDDIDRAQEGGQVDHDALWSRITEQREEVLKRHTEAEADPMFIDTILLQAEESMDEDLLDLLDRKWPGKEHAISSDPEVRKKIMTTRTRIQNGLAALATEKRLEEERAEKRRTLELKDKIITGIAHDPYYVPDEADLQEIGRVDPEFRTNLGKIRQDLRNSEEFPEDDKSISHIILEIDKGAGKAFVYEKFEQGVIRDPDTLKMLIDRANTVEKAKNEGGIFEDPTYKRMVKMIEGAAGPGVVDAFGNSKQTLDTIRAINDYNAMVLDWYAKNPDADFVERSKHLTEIGNVILEGLTPDAQATVGAGPLGATKYTPMDQREQPQQQPGGDDSGQGTMPSSTGTQRYRSEGHRQAVQTFANKYGLSEQEAYSRLEEVYNMDQEDVPDESLDQAIEQGRSLWERLVDWWTGGGEQQAQADPKLEEHRNRLVALLQNPPLREDGTSIASDVPTDGLLSLIAGVEGTDAGDSYNETLAYGKLTGGDVQLTRMTLDQVDMLQTEMLSHPGNRWNSSAVGRYQIVRDTLRDLRRQLGLSGDELFDEAMQDRLAMALLERRGLKQWLAGKLSDEEFMSNLQKEWEGFKKRQSPLGPVYGKKRGGTIQVASTDPQAGFREFLQEQGLGKLDSGSRRSGGLVASTKRGYKPDLDNINPKLANKVSELQDAFGRTLPIVSGYRDAKRNRKAGGARKSQHLHGNAVDIDVSGMSQKERIRLIQMARRMGFGGIGVYANSIHLDLGRRRSWGPSYRNASLPAWARKALAEA